MSTKAKGSNAERELIHLLWEHGFAAIRVAGSGSMKHASPDVLAGKDGRVIAFECKSITDGIRYIPKEEIDQLLEFSRRFGAESYIAVRFNRKEWHFLLTEEIGKKATLKLSKEEIALRGLLLQEVLRV